MTEQLPRLTTKDLEKHFGVHRTTIIEWRKNGLPYYRLGGKIYFKENEVLDWVEENRKVDSDE